MLFQKVAANKKKLVFIILFSLLIALFCFFRLGPLLTKNVPYTFDQGRDFLVVRQLVRNLDLPFVGPTTGIVGVYHGAWWYYFLAVPYLFFNGNPIGFYWFIFLASLIPTTLFAFFLLKEFSRLTAIFFLSLVTASTYLIGSATFAISSVFTIPFIFLFSYSLYHFLKSRRLLYLFLIFLSLSLVFEAEVPFGLFLTPAFLATIFLTQKYKNFFNSRKKIGVALLAFLVPTVPRILFEFKNFFPEVRAILHFFSAGKIHVFRSYNVVLQERIKYFWDFYRGIFFDGNPVVALSILLVFLFTAIILFHKDKEKIDPLRKDYISLLIVQVVFLFFFSLIYKDNFWYNYLEGLSYLFIFIQTTLFFILTKSSIKPLRGTMIVICASLIFFSGLSAINQVSRTKAPKEGLVKHINIVKTLYSLTNKKRICVRVYTPPVIPHTYNYLFSHYQDVLIGPEVTGDYVDNSCFYIIEDDDYLFRIEKFRQDHIPKQARLEKSFRIEKDVTIELWTL